MIGPPGCRHAREALGVYVLGAIDPAERASVDEHLATCASCREELASLAGMPALLRRIPNSEAERLLAAGQDDYGDVPPPELLHGLLARASAVKRARRWQRLAAAAAVAILALGGGAALVNAAKSGPGGPSPHIAWAHIASSYNPATRAKLTVKAEPESWGTLMDVQALGVAPGATCRLAVLDSAGHWWPAGSWRAEQYSDQSGWFPASAAVPWHDVQAFELLAGNQVLVKAPVS
ncbi:MAG TPA: zf-HC2 domain-containing protein [Streptosporangiaceae bacterium]|nr:zf-HC2 domain-containing protein [Streptosporangiaceae bacterium]